MRFVKKYHRYSVLIFVYAVFVVANAGIAAQDTPATPSRARVIQTPTPTPGKPPAAPLTPTPSPAASPTPVPIQTLDSLQTKIRQRLFSPELRRGRVGIKIVSLASSKVIFENDADKYFMPASNMKNFTVAAALERLGPDFRFVTSVYANALPDPTGTVKGDLRIYGRGDISISTAFFGTTPSDPETYFKGIDRLADAIAVAGVKRIEGSIIGDESYLKGFAIPETWEWDDLQTYYGAEVSALPLNDNAVDLAVLPAAPGTGCVVTIAPANNLMQIVNLCVTTNAGAKRELRVVKKLDRNLVEITGTMPRGDTGYKSSIAFSRPAELFVAILKQRLELRGVVVTGNSRTLPQNIKADPTQVEIAKLESPPLSLIAAKTMKPSQNMFTETLLWTLGEWARQKPPGSSADSSQLGMGEVGSFLTSIGVPDEGIRQYDGSGLSRHNLITPSAVVTLYSYMAKQSKYSQAWRDSLTIGGVDGTLRNRFKGTAAEGNMRGKTGTIDQVSALSGYVKTASGEELVVSLIVNGVAETRTRTSMIDDIIVNLANFNGKIE